MSIGKRMPGEPESPAAVLAGDRDGLGTIGRAEP
ncbi:hypothetical protein H4W34_006214 [Actinomadura algeriensis]|uniref:Uncharacterized protein n=1 Tax=Actinomadura algeriensis TaxID=1679523 RepID=A0ABR9K0L7_9ACTN|nr:hypothetical protein [Actinomadura algeriensis]